MIAFGLYLLKVSICLAGLYALYLLVFKDTTFFRFNRFYLLFSVLAAFVIPVVQLSVFADKYELIHHPIMDTPFNEMEYAPLLPNQQLSTYVSDTGYVKIIAVIYFAGVCFLLIRFVISIVQMIALKRNAVSDRINNLTIVRTSLQQPLSFLTWIFIPQDQHIDPLIVEHESVHITQYHWIDLLCIEIVSIILWFNPLLKFYRRAIKLQHEYLADAHTVGDGVHLELYLNCLLKQIQQESGYHFVNQFYSKSIKQRIMMMTKDKTPQRVSAMYLFLIPVVCFLLVAFSGKPVSVPVAAADVVISKEDTNNIPSAAPVEMKKAKLGSGYGERIHPTTHQKQMHLGIDFILPEGEPVTATADGEVVASQNDEYRGNYITVKHDEVYTTSYSHLKSSAVKEGDKVKQGQLLGYIGSTGKLSSEPHLHYEVTQNGKNVDPKDYLPR